MQKAVGVEFEGLRLDGFPGFPVEMLTKDGVVGRVAEVLAWTVAQTESDRHSPVAPGEEAEPDRGKDDVGPTGVVVRS
jgi:hypothetical protein